MITTVNLISGEGSTNLAILDAQRPCGKLHGLVKTLAIVSSDPNAPGIERAIRQGFPEFDIRVANRKKAISASSFSRFWESMNRIISTNWDGCR